MFGIRKLALFTALTALAVSASAFIPCRDGNVVSREDAKAQSTGYFFDGMNRIDRIEYPDATQSVFDHDANGNLTLSSNETAEVTFAYDEMNRLTVSTQSVYSVSSVVRNSYDLNGNRTNIVYPGRLNVSYSYDEENRLTGTVLTGSTISTPLTFSFSYDGASRLAGMSYPNGINSAFGYDAENKVVSYNHGAFLNHSITRDLRGYKTQEDIYAGLIPNFTNGLRQTRTHNDADQLLTAGTGEYSYDPNGNLTNSVWGTYEWDYNNRLDATPGVQYLYDASGVRIGRIAGVSPAVTNYFVIDYADGLKCPLAETDASGNVTRYYVWAGFRLLAHIEADGTVRYYHGDELGSTLALSDSAGNVTDQFAYAPYGELLSRTGTNGTAFLWLGGYGVYYDAAADLHLTLHRAYSAEQKRFISCDPIGLEGGPNLYAYGDMNPLFFVDPYGLNSIVLNESKGAWGAGHQALAVQGAAGWIYLSQDGPNGGGGHAVYYNNQDEMMRDLGGRYDRHFLIETTTKQDAAVYQSASANLSNPYSANPFDKNRFHCGDLVSTALQAGSVPTGPEPFGNRPNAAFKNIVSANTISQPSPGKVPHSLPQSSLSRPNPVAPFPPQTMNRQSQGPLK